MMEMKPDVMLLSLGGGEVQDSMMMIIILR